MPFQYPLKYNSCISVFLFSICWQMKSMKIISHCKSCELFMGIIQNKQLRLHGWDYRSSGVYYVTVCTYKRVKYFGEVVDGKMVLSHVGVIADILWSQIPYHLNAEL